RGARGESRGDASRRLRTLRLTTEPGAARPANTALGGHGSGYQASTFGRRFPGRSHHRGTSSSSSVLIQRRLSGGSLTSSISKYDATPPPRPRSYAAATVTSYRRSRSVGSSIASSSRRIPSLTAPSSPIAPNSDVGQPIVNGGALKPPPAIAWAPR